MFRAAPSPSASALVFCGGLHNDEGSLAGYGDDEAAFAKLLCGTSGREPCYLVSAAEGGYLYRLADDVEATLLETGADLLDHTREVLADLASPCAEVRFAASRLDECLGDALLVAESRGLRLAVPEVDEDDGE